jgi:hypothetical protein
MVGKNKVTIIWFLESHPALLLEDKHAIDAAVIVLAY